MCPKQAHCGKSKNNIGNHSNCTSNFSLRTFFSTLPKKFDADIDNFLDTTDTQSFLQSKQIFPPYK